MSLVEETLVGVSDGKQLSAHRSEPLKQLIDEYNAYAAHNDNATPVTDDSTGSDLKTGIRALEAEQQVQLLYTYLTRTNRLIGTETEDVKQARNFKYWAMRLSVYTGLTISVGLFGSVTAIAWKTGVGPSNEIVSAFMSTAAEIVKVFFSSGG